MPVWPLRRPNDTPAVTRFRESWDVMGAILEPTGYGWPSEDGVYLLMNRRETLKATAGALLAPLALTVTEAAPPLICTREIMLGGIVTGLIVSKAGEPDEFYGDHALCQAWVDSDKIIEITPELWSCSRLAMWDGLPVSSRMKAD